MFDLPHFSSKSCKRNNLVRKRRASQAALRKAPGRTEEEVGRAEAEGGAEEGCGGGEAEAETRGGQSKRTYWDTVHEGAEVHGKTVSESAALQVASV